MNDYYSTRPWPSSGARFLRSSARLFFILAAVGPLPFYVLTAQAGVPQMLGLALVQAALLVALWRACQWRRWGCVALGAIVWILAGLAMTTLALLPVAFLSGLSFSLIIVEEWQQLKTGF